MTFLLSTLALVAAPFLYAFLARFRGSRDALEGFVLIIIAGIVGLHIVPEAWRLTGWASLLALAAGGVFPLLLERIYRRVLERAHLVVLILAAIGVFVHAVLDGIALLPSAASGNELALGVILHRLPVGMAVWWVLRPQFGPVAAMCVMGLIIIATAGSYFFGAGLLDADLTTLVLFQSFIAGSLLHIALVGTVDGHEHHEPVPGSVQGEAHHAHPERWWAVLMASRRNSVGFWVGLGVGLVTVLLLPHATVAG